MTIQKLRAAVCALINNDERKIKETIRIYLDSRTIKHGETCKNHLRQ
jgi:hypothetical protein